MNDQNRERPDLTVPFQGAAVVMAIVAVFVVLHRPAANTAPGAAPSGAAGSAQTAGGIVFQPSYEAAMALARSEHKPLLIDFYTDWCGVCKYLDTQYSDPGVISALSGSVVVKVNAEQRTDLAGTYRVSGYPTLVTLDSNGNVTNSMAGAYNSPAEFASWLSSNLHA